MKINLKTAALAGLAATALAGAAATTASAAIVCNGEGVCWHTHTAYAYRPEYGVVVHEDNWRWGPNDHYAWREHEGRGYWRNNVWIGF